ncbi:hypothetical protein F4825DRAFT_433100 [Nemania diffusa]|nr:hypothetical protein F4825DRAFT_433100 [Nemania diffusa]
MNMLFAYEPSICICMWSTCTWLWVLKFLQAAVLDKVHLKRSQHASTVCRTIGLIAIAITHSHEMVRSLKLDSYLNEKAFIIVFCRRMYYLGFWKFHYGPNTPARVGGTY